MPNSAWRKVFHQLRRSALHSDGAGLSDAQLLDCFLADRDEDAFAALMRRHGPMVFGVCRRLLPSWQDAEDAFQATFLVLARKATTIQPRRQVGNWLYGVAYRTALEAQTILAKRRAKERPLQDVAQPEPADESWREVQPILDRELNGLPEKYRKVIICCDLQGKTRREAAYQLGWPEGTVAARLARGRGLLRARLVRRGLTLSVGSLASLFSCNRASACVPKALEVCTLKAATVCAAGKSMATGLVSAHVAILTQGVLKNMYLTKLKLAAGFLVVLGVIGFGTGVGIYANSSQTIDAASHVALVYPRPNSDQGLKFPSETKETDPVNALYEIEDRKRSRDEDDVRESKKKVEKKKRRHEEDEDDEDDGRESKKKAGVKKRKHEDEDDEHEGKKRSAARKRERDDEKEKGREAKKPSKKKREKEEEDDHREHATKKNSAKKREREDDKEHREIKKKGKKKSRHHDDDEDDDRGGKKETKKAKRHHEDDSHKEGRKIEKKKHHEDEDDDDRRESMKKSGKKKRHHEEDEDDEHEGKKKRRHKDD